MTPLQINTALRKKGFDQTAIALALGCSPSLISKTINRRAVSRRVAVAISKILELPAREVFPEYDGFEQITPDLREQQKTRLKKLLA